MKLLNVEKGQKLLSLSSFPNQFSRLCSGSNSCSLRPPDTPPPIRPGKIPIVVRYNCRKNLAETRLRVKGYLVKIVPEKRAALKLNNKIRSSRGSSGGKEAGADSGRYCIHARKGVGGWSRKEGRRGRRSTCTWWYIPGWMILTASLF